MQPGTTGLRYIQPQYTDIPCTIKIGIAVPLACRIRTSKTFSAPVSEVQAYMAHLRGIRWGRQVDHNTSRLSFIGDEGTELVKGPTVASAPLGFLSGLLVGAFPDAGQILQRYRSLGGKSVGNQVLADLMVGLALETGFTPRQPCQKLPATTPRTPGAFRGFLLQCRALAAVPITQRGQCLTAPALIIARMGNVSASKIHTERIGACTVGWQRALDLDVQEERAILALDQRGTRRGLAFEPSLLIHAHDGVKPCTAMEQRQAKRPVPFPKAEDACVIVHRGRFKDRVHFCRDFERRTDPRNGAYRQVRRQAKAFTNRFVAGVLHLDLVGGVLLPRHVRNEGTRIGKRHKCGVQFDTLLFSWRQFASNRAYSFHEGILSHAFITCNLHG